MLQHIGGIDHCVVLVRDLDKAAETFARAGFTVAPRGVQDLQEEDQYLLEVNLEDLETSSGERQEYWLLAIQAARKACAIAREEDLEYGEPDEDTADDSSLEDGH